MPGGTGRGRDDVAAVVHVGAAVLDQAAGIVVPDDGVRVGNRSLDWAGVEVIISLLAEDVDLGQTARMNAAYTAVSLGQQKTWASQASKDALASALATASNDDDRYVVAAAVEGLKWLQLGELGETSASSAAAKLVKKLVWERWCPINSVRAPF